MTRTATIPAARLHGPKDVRLDHVDAPPPPAPGQATIRVRSVGICGSDLHTYLDGHVGGTELRGPLAPGHEFAAVVDAVGPDAHDGEGRPLAVGTRVAVDPHQACGKCEPCLHGHPNLCIDHQFAGLWPTDGAMQEKLNVPARTCYPLPDAIDDEMAALLEPLGVALHAVDLGNVHVGHRVAVIGAGPIGLLCAQVAQLACATPVFITDRLEHRLDLARRFGAEPIHIEQSDPVAEVMQRTAGRGVDVALEAAWSDESAVMQALDMLRPGGRLVIVGISSDDKVPLRHSTARRKGITLAMVRRMKHTYPRAIRLVAAGRIDLKSLISHRFDLASAGEAFHVASEYLDGAVKVMVNTP